MQSPDLVVPHAIVFRQNDLNRVTADFQLTAEAEDYVGQPTDLGDRRAFGSDFNNEHGQSGSLVGLVVDGGSGITHRLDKSARAAAADSFAASQQPSEGSSGNKGRDRYKTEPAVHRACRRSGSHRDTWG